MARVKGGYTTRHRRKKVLKLAKGTMVLNIDYIEQQMNK